PSCSIALAPPKRLDKLIRTALTASLLSISLFTSIVLGTITATFSVSPCIWLNLLVLIFIIPLLIWYVYNISWYCLKVNSFIQVFLNYFYLYFYLYHTWQFRATTNRYYSPLLLVATKV